MKAHLIIIAALALACMVLWLTLRTARAEGKL